MIKNGCRFSFITAIFTLVSLFMPYYASLSAQEKEAKPDDSMITMEFQEVDLKVIIKFISELTGKNFILDDKVQGKKVTVISPSKISRDEAYKVFESILEIKGLATVPSGKIIKIVPTKDATGKSLKTILGKEKAPLSDTLITRLISLKYVDTDEMVKILKPLMSRDSKIDSYPPTNTLILTDISSNISRLLKILTQLDIKADEMIMEVIPLQYASAEVMAKQLQEIVQTVSISSSSSSTVRRRATASKAKRSKRKTSAAQQTFSGKIISDDRTNSLIILTTKAQLKEIRELIQKLDYDTPRAYGNINVYYLEYADSENMSKLLSGLVSGARSLSAKGAKGRKTTPTFAKTMASFEGEVSITADTATNSLLIVASPRDYQTLKQVIAKLDIRRKQVYVKAVIMEVSPTFIKDLGVELRGGVPMEEGDSVESVMMGGTNYNLGTDNMINSVTAVSTGDTAAMAAAGLFPLTLGDNSGLTLGGVLDRIRLEDSDGNAFFLPANMFLIHALQNKTEANILSTPHLIAMDNEESEIVVGKNVPFITSTSQSTVSTLQQVQRENVGITLRFTPKITEGDYIQLDLYQEISALIPSPIEQDANRVGPTTSTRKATNSVLVRDGQTIIIGGLMEDRITKTKGGVPWISDIPVLGWLFRHDRTTVDKSNLLIFLTPAIIREDQDIQRLYEEKQREMQHYKKKYNIQDNYSDVRPFEKKSTPSKDISEDTIKLNLGAPPDPLSDNEDPIDPTNSIEAPDQSMETADQLSETEPEEQVKPSINEKQPDDAPKNNIPINGDSQINLPDQPEEEP